MYTIGTINRFIQSSLLNEIMLLKQKILCDIQQ